LPIFFRTAAFDPSENRHSWLARVEKLNPRLGEDEPPAFTLPCCGRRKLISPRTASATPMGRDPSLTMARALLSFDKFPKQRHALTPAFGDDLAQRPSPPLAETAATRPPMPTAP
jgi:hypothetical protein